MPLLPSAEALHCSRPWKAVTFLSDGTAVCACIDAGKRMPLGNLNTMSFDEIWNGEAYQSLRRDIVEDIRRRPLCVMCPNRIPEGPREPGKLSGHHKPRHVYIETVAACNLSCPGCDRELITGTREGQVMKRETFERIIDDLSPHLEYLEYHVGGENWAHKDSAEMVRYAKERNPHCFTLTSTNGHYFSSEKQRREALLSGIDVIIFSVDGVDQESYVRYRVGGDFDQVYENMRAMAAMREEMGITWPKMVWRYILFPWNDSAEQMERARELSKACGVDSLCWQLNLAHEEELQSERYFEGSPHLEAIRHEMWDTVEGLLPVNPRWHHY